MPKLAALSKDEPDSNMMDEPTANNELRPQDVDVTPTKALFVDMLTRDIRLDNAISDLVDNSIDGARRLKDSGRLDGLEVNLRFSGASFSISDNCGGIPIDTARNYAFRFGRPRNAPRSENSVGMFGVGMKRALFKFGRHFRVESLAPSSSFTIDVDVDAWENEDTAWTFTMDPFSETDKRSVEDTATTITVDRLNSDASSTFALPTFENTVIRQLEQSQQVYIERGIDIAVNGRHLVAVSWTLLEGAGIAPGLSHGELRQGERGRIRYRIYVGASDSDPSTAGWYIICNGRVILAADQSDKTGWMQTSSTVKVPKYHNQFARFRGYTFIDADDPDLLPWNTTKDDIDVDSVLYRNIREHMIQDMRLVIDFLNGLDNEDEEGSDDTPLHDAIRGARPRKVQEIPYGGRFSYPTARPSPPVANISYAVDLEKAQALKEELGVSTNKALGLKTFQLAYAKYVVGED